MPMSFPDMRSLISTARVFKFRQPNTDETEADFRIALHNHVKPIDRIESFEIKFGVGWNEWTDEQKLESISS